jgi:hypothetical protein
MEKIINKQILSSVLFAAGMLSMSGAGAVTLDPATNCAIQKQKISAEYFSCLYKVDFTSRKAGNGKGSSKPCDVKFDRQWAMAESVVNPATGLPACPVDVGTGVAGDPVAVRESLALAYDSYLNYFLGIDALPVITTDE